MSITSVPLTPLAKVLVTPPVVAVISELLVKLLRAPIVTVFWTRFFFQITSWRRCGSIRRVLLQTRSF